jgi:hypothetical protein
MTCVFFAVVRVPWTAEEREAVFAHFQRHVLDRSLPGKREIETVLEKEPALGNRKWRNVKDFLKNHHDSRWVAYFHYIIGGCGVGFESPSKTTAGVGGGVSHDSLHTLHVAQQVLHAFRAITGPLPSHASQLMFCFVSFQIEEAEPR